jgi:hypothetical protein
VSERRRIATSVGRAPLGQAVQLRIRPVSGERIVTGYVLALAAIALAALVRAAHAAAEYTPSAFEHALEPHVETPTRPPELMRTERELTLGVASAGHLHARLLPILREAAAARLAAHHNVDLERRPDAARRLLGDDAWELLRPDRSAPEDLYAPGLPLRRIRRIVEKLEAL